MKYAIEPAQIPVVEIVGEERVMPVHRIFCVGRNYAAHAREMGVEVDREAPFFFTKSPFAVSASGQPVVYPPETGDLHPEMELGVAIGEPGFRIAEENALDYVFGYCCALDMTRRDLQAIAKQSQKPWDFGKDFEQSAVIAPITPAGHFGPIAQQNIRLEVDGAVRQDAKLDDMVWRVEGLIAYLSRFYHLKPGDIILTGTPAGVGPVQPRNRIEGFIDGLTPVRTEVGAPR